MEEACDRGLVSDVGGLEDHLRGRLATTGTVSAHVAAAVCARVVSGADLALLWPAVDAECDARLVSPAARRVSRQLGAQLMRTATRVFDGAWLGSLAEPHHPVATGAVAAAAGLSPEEAAAAAAYGLVAGAASAAVRLLGLDPAGVARMVASLSPEVDRLAAAAALGSSRPLACLPDPGAPAADMLAEAHFERKERLFAS